MGNTAAFPSPRKAIPLFVLRSEKGNVLLKLDQRCFILSRQLQHFLRSPPWRQKSASFLFCGQRIPLQGILSYLRCQQYSRRWRPGRYTDRLPVSEYPPPLSWHVRQPLLGAGSCRPEGAIRVRNHPKA